MSDVELAVAADAPLDVVPALRGARSLVEARDYARLVLEPQSVELPPEAGPTLERLRELRAAGPERLTADDARALVRELKAVGGDLRSVRLALTGSATGPELSAILAALSHEETEARVTHALRGKSADTIAGVHVYGT